MEKFFLGSKAMKGAFWLARESHHQGLGSYGVQKSSCFCLIQNFNPCRIM